MLNQNIKNLRKQKGYTQETFAQELNVVRQTVSKWEKGYSVPDAVMLERIAELCEVSVGELLGSEEIKSEERSDLKQISEQLSVLNSQFARELARKRRNRRIALITLAVILAAAFISVIFGLVPHEQVNYTDDDGNVIARKLDGELDKAVSDAIFSANSSSYLSGECEAESHFVLGTKETNDTVTVYIIEKYTQFGFHNGFFTDISGGTTPVVLTFGKTDEGYTLISRESAQDGGQYTSSIKKLFPARYARKILRGLSESESEELWINRVRQAQAYLRSINRNAAVCKYADIQTEFLSDHGISSEVSNKICEKKWEYDYIIGNHEVIEDGVRYVYQTGYDEINGWVTFTKFEYDTGTIAEFSAVDGETGEDVIDAPVPETVKYYKGTLEANQFTTAAYYQ